MQVQPKPTESVLLWLGLSFSSRCFTQYNTPARGHTWLQVADACARKAQPEQQCFAGILQIIHALESRSKKLLQVLICEAVGQIRSVRTQAVDGLLQGLELSAWS